MTISTNPDLQPNFFIFRDSPTLNIKVPGHERLATQWASSDQFAWKELTDKLSSFGLLGSDWDGQGAEPPDRRLIAGAIKLAIELRDNQTTPADRVLAGVNGEIFFEWVSFEYLVEIEVIEPNQAEIRSVDPKQRSVVSGLIHW